MNKLVLSILVLCVIFISGCASSPDQSEEKSIAAVASFFSDMKDRNFSKSVSFCSEVTPKIASEYKKYLDDYKSGTELGLKEVMKEINPESMLMNEKDSSELLRVQEQQGDLFLQKIKGNPVQLCAYLSSIFSSSSRLTAKNEILSMYESYKRAREKLCSKSPKPDNCL